MAKKKKEVIIDEIVVETPAVEPIVTIVPSKEKEELLALYEKLQAMRIRSISDLENKIANCR